MEDRGLPFSLSQAEPEQMSSLSHGRFLSQSRKNRPWNKTPGLGNHIGWGGGVERGERDKTSSLMPPILAGQPTACP
jgi:hypothetical protein